MDGGGAADGEGAAEDGHWAAVERSDLGAPADSVTDPAMESLGDGRAADESGQRVATGVEGPGQRTASARGGVSAATGGAWAEGSVAGMAGGSGQGIAGSASAAAVRSRSGQYSDRSSSAAAVGSGQGASRLASATWVCKDGGYCSRRDADNCPWRIHASTTEDKCTGMVKKNPCGHDCSSTRRKKKTKNGTKHWVCDKVKDWLIEDATLGAKALQKKIKEHHKVNLHYKRVYMAVAGRPQTERHKGCSEKKRKSGQHLCPICKEYGHHWHKCKKGNKDDIAALMDVREPPKKRRKTTKSTESSIVPRGDDAPAAAMYFPPSQSLEITTKKKGKHSQTLETTNKKNGKGCKRSGKGKKMELAKKDGSCLMVPFDSPAMGTRSKKTNPASPAMSTRSKRRLSL